MRLDLRSVSAGPHHGSLTDGNASVPHMPVWYSLHENVDIFCLQKSCSEIDDLQHGLLEIQCRRMVKNWECCFSLTVLFTFSTDYIYLWFLLLDVVGFQVILLLYNRLNYLLYAMVGTGNWFEFYPCSIDCTSLFFQSSGIGMSN